MPKQKLLRTFFSGMRTGWQGMRLTIRHLLAAIRRRKIQDIRDPGYLYEGQGLTTLAYPYESIPVPDIGRYKLHNEIEDCIVCDKCAKVCPVDCIEIEPIKSVGEFGKTSDGTPKRIYAAKFDIDMAKCCFCGLCTTVCPTECLTMTPEYDFATFDITKINFGFGNMTEEEADDKRRDWEVHQVEKQASKSAPPGLESAGSEQKTGVFRPRMPSPKQTNSNTTLPISTPKRTPDHPEAIGNRPAMKPVQPNPLESSEPKSESGDNERLGPVRSKPMMKPPGLKNDG